MIKICIISDTHMQMNKIIIPECDILIHCGDHSYDGSFRQMSEAISALAKQTKDKAKYVVAISGNHDWLASKQLYLMEELCKDNNIIYLHDSFVELLGKKIYGSPYTPEFCGWAFPLYTKEESKRKWSIIPDDTNILITHGPRKDIRDLCPDGSKVGDIALGERIDELKLDLHCFGHIHWSSGISQFNGTTYVNAAICDEQYLTTNPVRIIEIE